MMVPAGVDLLSTYDIPLPQCWVHISDLTLAFLLRFIKYIIILNHFCPNHRFHASERA